jgi:hypothetical protein
MRRVFPAHPAELLQFEFILMLFFIFCGGVVLILADRTFHRDYFSHDFSPVLLGTG